VHRLSPRNAVLKRRDGAPFVSGRLMQDLSIGPARLAAMRGKSAATATAITIATFAFYTVTLVAALAAPSLWVALPASLLCGLAIGLMFIVGHDACHQAFTGSALANGLIGRVVFLPSLHPYSLWDLGHNRTHHRFNNVRGKDYVWEPMSPADYRSATPLQRLRYRFYRSPPGLLFYYGCEIWAKRMFFVLPLKVADRRPAYAWDLLTVWAFLPLQLWLIVRLGHAFGRAPAHALLIGFLVPFLTWNGLISFVIYLHHIHPRIPWYESVDAWRVANGRIAGTAHVNFPPLVDKLLLHIMQHNAHHYAPGVPLYRLAPLQRLIQARGGVAWRWSPRPFLAIVRQCKLFDYDAGAWREFDASPQRARMF
jgi:omega-6 fatty acid desaturase (delta-12 desaturase)